MEEEKEIEIPKNQEHPFEKIISDDRLKVEMKQTEGFLRNSFTTQQHVHLTNSIRFADAKAGALVTINGLVLKFITDLLHTTTGLSSLLLKIALIVLIVSILCSLIVVYPRFLNSKEKGIIYWENIQNYKKEDYIEEITNGDANKLLQSSVENNYYQAAILTKKFKQLLIGFQISIIAYVVIGFALFFKYF